MENLNKLYYENQGTNTYLVYKIEEGDALDSLSLGMLTNNRIAGLAQTIFSQMDYDKYIKFNVSSKVSATQFFSGTVNKKRLLSVFSGIIEAMLSAEEYMLDTRTILLDMDYIFADVSTCETVLICLPISNREANDVEIGSFFRNIMFRTQFDQTENCDHIAQIINYLNSNPIIALNEFKSIIDGLMAPKNDSVSMMEKPETVTSPTNARQPLSREDCPIQNVSEVKVAEQKKVDETKKEIKQPVVEKTTVQKPVVQKPVSTVKNVTNMAVPPRQADINRNIDTVSNASHGQEISFFYLMQHYNKENAAIYRAQKEAKKQNTAGNKGDKVAKNNGKPAQTINVNYNVPGQNTGKRENNVGSDGHETLHNVEQLRTSDADSNIASMQQSQPLPPLSPQQGKSANFGETTVLGGGKIGETTVLSGELNPQQKPVPHLIRERNNEKIILDKPVFRIGKERSYVDYFISDNTAVSRSHANIVARDECYFLMDTNSTNHTFVNGMMIQSNVEMKLEHGDKIRLANEGFEFKLY